MRIRFSIPVALVLAAALIGSAGASDIPTNPRLTAAMVKLSGRVDATVRCYPVDDGAEGGTWINTGEVQLEPSVCRRLVKWYPLTSPRAVAVFAHEAGHLVRGMAEGDANCFAAVSLYRAARLVGFGPHQAQVVAAHPRWYNGSTC